MRYRLLTGSAITVALFMLFSCASTPDVPQYEKQFNPRVFTNVATDKAMMASMKRFGENCRIVMDPSLSDRPFEVILSDQSDKTVDLLADKGLEVMVPIIMPAYFLDPSVSYEVPANGTTFAFKIQIQRLSAAIVEMERRVVQAEVVIAAEVLDPQGAPLARAEGSGTGQRTYAYRLYPTVELACAHALANALNDLGRKLSMDTPELANLLQ